MGKNILDNHLLMILILITLMISPPALGYLTSKFTINSVVIFSVVVVSALLNSLIVMLIGYFLVRRDVAKGEDKKQ